MTPPVVYPDVVEIVRAHLVAQLAAEAGTYPVAADAQVVVREPDPFPDVKALDAGVVRVRRSGGPADNVVTDRARVDLIVWHALDSKAAALANLCRALMRSLPGVHTAGTVTLVTEFAGPVSVWDEDRDLPRYLLTDEVRTRGASL